MNTSTNKKLNHWGPISWWRRFRKYANLCVTSGFVPRRSALLSSIGVLFARLWAFVMVGKVTVIGAEHSKSDGYTVYCPNHSSLLDAIVMVPILPGKMHYMAAVEEMRGVYGLKAMLMGAMGCFPVDRTRGKTVIRPAIGLVADGNNLTLFPEGKISPSGEFLVFKNGVGWITMGAFERLPLEKAKLIRIVPVHICFGTRHEESALSFSKMFFHWRKGATVTFHEPIYLFELDPVDIESLMAQLRVRIVSTECDTTSGE